MEIKKEYPPNWQYIKTLNPPKGAVFCFGDIVYSPHGEPPEDVIFHEQYHSLRQGDAPDVWWTKYIHDPLFRQEEEAEAFAAQWVFVKRHFPRESHKEALIEMAEALSRDYQLNLTCPQAETLIRHKAKTMILLNNDKS